MKQKSFFRSALVLALILISACKEKKTEVPEATVQQGIDRSVADVRAAEAAASAQAEQSATIAELNAKSAK